MKVQTVNAEEKEMFKCETDISVKTIFYAWSINNFSLCTDFLKKKLCSPIFCVEQSPFILQLRTIGEKEKEFGFISINLFKLKEDGTNCHLKYTLSVIDTKGNKLSLEDEVKFSDKRRVGLRLKVDPQNTALLHDDTIIIHCSMKILLDSSHEHSTTINAVKVQNRNAMSKHHYVLREITRFSICYVIIFFLSLVFKYIDNTHHTAKSCAGYYMEMHELIEDSISKVMYIAKALNLSPQKITSEYIESCIHKFNLTNALVSVNSINSTL